MLGWKVIREGEFDLGMKHLTDDELKVVNEVTLIFEKKAKEWDGEDVQAHVKGLLAGYCFENSITIDAEQEKYLVEYILSNGQGFAAFDRLIGDERIEEIAHIDIGKPLYVYLRGAGWKTVNAKFTNYDKLVSVINKMARQSGRRITLQNPRLNATLKTGARLHATIKPVSDAEVTIRRFRGNPISWCDLLANKTISAEALAFLSMAMQADMNIVIFGNTASGKTSTLNALFSFVSFGERVVIVEETPEINIPHPHQVRLVPQQDLGITLDQLVTDTLRMRPDRAIIGEARSRDEFRALFDSMLSGQARACYATLHALNEREAVARMLAMGIEPIDLRAIDLFVLQKRTLAYSPGEKRNIESRKILSISEYVDNMKTICAEAVIRDLAVSSRAFGKICQCMNLSEDGFFAEMERRSEFFAANQNIPDYQTATATIQNMLYGEMNGH